MEEEDCDDSFVEGKMEEESLHVFKKDSFKNVEEITQLIVTKQQIKGEWNFDQNLLNSIKATSISSL